MSPVTSGFAPIHGLQMYYEIYGNGKPLVLIHGGGSTIQSNWSKVIPLLASSRQVIGVDMQAHGRTADIDREFTFEQDADDIAALLKYLKIAKADVFGFSNGGQSTIQLAVRHPAVVNRIVIASSGYTREGFVPGFWDGMQGATFDNMPQVLKDAYLEANPNPEGLLKMFHRDANRMNAFNGWSDDLIRQIKAPTLVLSGDRDVITPEHATQIARLIPNSRLTILPSGHGDYLGERYTGNTNSKLHTAAVNIVLDFLDEP